MSYKNQILKQFTNGKYGKKTYLDLVRKKTNSGQTANSKLPIIIENEKDSQIEKIIDRIKQDDNDEKCDLDKVGIPVSINNEQNINSDINLITDQYMVKKIEFKGTIPKNKISLKNIPAHTNINIVDSKTQTAPKKILINEKELISNTNNTMNTIVLNDKNTNVVDIFTEQTEIMSDERGPIISKSIVTEPKEIPNTSNNSENKIKCLEDKISELEDYVVEITIEIEKLKDNQKNIISVINKLSSDMSITKNKITR
jgi:hypothetical protein